MTDTTLTLSLRITLLAFSACAAPAPSPAPPAPTAAAPLVELFAVADTVPYPSAEEAAALLDWPEQGESDGPPSTPGVPRALAERLDGIQRSWQQRDKAWAARGAAAAGQPAAGASLCRPEVQVGDAYTVLRCPADVPWLAAPGLESFGGLAVVALDGRIAGWCRADSARSCVLGAPFVADDAAWRRAFFGG